jgi:hypothetical protein
MADLADLVIYLGTGRTVAWVGAGPSVEIGLPIWRKLADDILAKCQSKPNRFLRRIDELFKNRKFPEMFDQVVLGYGKSFLMDSITDILKDPGGEGSAYKALSSLTFLAYFTTNFEQILLRHLEAAGRAFKPYLNSQEQLASVDVDTIPSLVHIHGRLDDPDSMLVTRTDYQKFYKNGDHKYFQDFIFSYLMRDRIVFIGYSLKDPDFIALQEIIAVNLRRHVPALAIMPNASQEDIDYWSRYYNIDIISYESLNDDHSGLVSILTTVAKFLAVGKTAPIRISDNDLRDAQALYMWERFRSATAYPAIKDALSSVVLDILSRSSKRLTLSEISIELREKLKINVVENTYALKSVLDELVANKWLVCDVDSYHLESQQRDAINTTEQQFKDLLSVFRRQIEIDIRRVLDIKNVDQINLTDIALQTILDIFEIRGHEVLRGIFGENTMNPANAADLIQVIWTRANDIPDAYLRGPFVEFILRMFIQPNDIYARVLAYLARAFFCIQALRMDPSIGDRIRHISNDRTVILDANVLIPMTAKGEDRFEFSRMLLDRARASGLILCTTSKYLEEVRRHAQWAIDRVNEFGAQSMEILYAARGEGGYDANAYLKGFITQDGNQYNSEFLVYLRDCFGGSFQREEFEKHFNDVLGIHIISDEILTKCLDIGKDAYNEAQSMMLRWNLSRDELERKSTRRIESEAEVYCLLKEWPQLLALIPAFASSNVTYLTSGSGVGRVIKSAGLTGRSMLIASPDALWQLLESLPEPDEHRPSFRSLILTSYFRLASHFLNPEHYRTFFEPLIREATTSFQKYKESLEEALGQGILPDSLEEFDPENRPKVVEDIERILNTRFTTENAEQKRLIEENDQLRKLLEEYQERERKRREFIQRQRGRPRN